MWCVPDLTAEFVERMEDVLRLYARKFDEKEPVVCLDERPVVLREDARRAVPMKPGRLARRDYEYVRCGTANVFCIVEPHRKTTDVCQHRPQAARLRARAAKDRGSLLARETYSSRPRQPEYPFAQVGDCRPRPPRRSPPLAPLRSPLHTQAWQLAERRRDRGEPRLSRVSRARPRRFSGRAHFTRQRVAPRSRVGGTHHQLDLPCR